MIFGFSPSFTRGPINECFKQDEKGLYRASYFRNVLFQKKKAIILFFFSRAVTIGKVVLSAPLNTFYQIVPINK